MKDIQKFTRILEKYHLGELSINVKNELKQILEMRRYEEIKALH
jgi:hypothetical protein